MTDTPIIDIVVELNGNDLEMPRPREEEGKRGKKLKVEDREDEGEGASSSTTDDPPPPPTVASAASTRNINSEDFTVALPSTTRVSGVAVRNKRSVNSRRNNPSKFVDPAHSLHFHGLQQQVKENRLIKTARTLNFVEFKHNILLSNISMVLFTCPNLQTLVFTHPRFSSYKEDKLGMASSRIATLIFNGPAGKQTRDESYVIQYLKKRVQFRALSQVIFRARDDDMKSTKSQRQLLPGGFSSSSDPSSTTVSAFLSKFRTTLKMLEISRPLVLHKGEELEVTLTFDALELMIPVSEPLGLNLQELKIDMSARGFLKLINSQRTLRVLEAYNNEPLSTHHFQAVIVCIQRCAPTLANIKLKHKFKLKISDSNAPTPPSVVHDCKSYFSCKALTYLNLGLSRSKFDNESNSHDDEDEIKLCRVTNIWTLPTTLSTITIHFDEIPDDDLELFVGRSVVYKNLKTLALFGNPKFPFQIKISWVKIYSDLPKIHVFQFRNYKINQGEVLDQALRDDISRKAKKFIFTKTFCVFVK